MNARHDFSPVLRWVGATLDLRGARGTGQTPAKAVENLRLEGARALLEDTNHTLDVVAQQTGFGDRNRMRRAFLRAYGQPPQAIRGQSRGYASIEESELAER
jgi:transcriptional regulator GlxA family with amidase domain